MENQTWLAAIMLITLFIFSLNEQLRKKSLAFLELQLREAKDQLNEFGDNIENLFNGFLRDHSNSLGFDAATKARLSIYLNDDEKSHFYPCGRYSPDPEFQKKGRTMFAHGQGCIWKAWKNGFHFDSAAPKTAESYKKYQTRVYSIPNTELSGLKMKPRLICGQRIEDPSGSPIGVIICEATESELFSVEQISSVLRPASEELCKMLTILQAFIPNPNDAEDVGL